MQYTQKSKSLVTDLYHIGTESYVEFKIPGGYNFGAGSTSMDQEQRARAVVVAKFYYITKNEPAIDKTSIIIKILSSNGKIWSGGQRSEVAGIPNMQSEFNGYYVFCMVGESGDHVDIDPLTQQFTVTFTDIQNQNYVFDSPYILQLSILDNCD